MAEKEFQLEVITPHKVIFSQSVVSVTAPGKEGYLGILANHAPLLTSLQRGKIEIRGADMTYTAIKVQHGFLETSRNKVDSLVDEAEIEKD